MWGHTQVSLVLVALVVLATVVNTQKPRDNTAAIGDISPPSVSFQCGTNPRKTFTLLLKSLGDEVILRPEATTSRPVAFERPTPSGESAISSRPRPGIPADAFNDPSARVERPLSSVKRQEGGLAAQAHPAGSLEPINGAVGFAVGGVIAEKNAWPWMALLGDTNEQGKITWFCAGALINEQWVLSALHCFLFTTVTVVRLGEHDYNDDGDGAVHEDFGVAETILHPDYVHPQGYHDLALLKLNRRVILKPFINPVCLPWGQESINDLTGTKVTLTGWGATQFAGEPSSVLQEVEITVFPSSDCDKSYSTLDDYLKKFPRGIGKETVCAGDRAGGRDACQSDSGGPLVSRNSAGQYTMAGVVSSGVGCGLKDFPGLYANIREEQYLAWVKKTAF
ncbi:venom protease-like isoform X2 [Homarus americanus]|uniref:venom protease-like isoform X2 n=1 Tax=Homarus americanus TaxID=6706 RepID=UPI001C48B21A|nr:venom protease-like isoform X2 [Homarus americanus]